MSISATYPYPVRDDESEAPAKIVEAPSSSAASVEKNTVGGEGGGDEDVGDVDVVDVGTEKADGAEGNEYYEYYYLYYDENGNVVSNTSAKPNSAAATTTSASVNLQQQQASKVQVWNSPQ